MQPFTIPALTLALLAACAPANMPLPATDEPDTCGALEARRHLGQPASKLDAFPLGVSVRIIPFDGAVTMDFSAERLNFYVDQSGRITRVACG